MGTLQSEIDDLESAVDDCDYEAWQDALANIRSVISDVGTSSDRVADSIKDTVSVTN